MGKVIGFYRRGGTTHPITKRTTRRIKRTKARYFGDNPKIRHSKGEHEQVNVQEPWEVRYEKEKAKETK